MSRMSCSAKGEVLKQTQRKAEQKTWPQKERNERRKAELSGALELPYSCKTSLDSFPSKFYFTAWVTLSRILLFPTNRSPSPVLLHPVSALESPEEITLYQCQDPTTRQFDVIGFGGTRATGFFKRYPGDSNVWSGLRTTVPA